MGRWRGKVKGTNPEKEGWLRTLPRASKHSQQNQEDNLLLLQRESSEEKQKLKRHVDHLNPVAESLNRGIRSSWDWSNPCRTLVPET